MTKFLNYLILNFIIIVVVVLNGQFSLFYSYSIRASLICSSVSPNLLLTLSSVFFILVIVFVISVLYYGLVLY